MANGPALNDVSSLTLSAAAPSKNEAGMVEGVVLVMACWCTVLASGLLSPVLPQIASAFSHHDNIEMLVGLVATMPALVVALLAVPSGRLADRFGQRRVLIGGLLIYGFAGVIPFWLGNLHAIIGARAMVGIGEAAVMTASTALISLRFSGARRTRWLAAQVAVANTLGVFVLLLGGQMGLLDWRLPFLAYSFALFLLVLTVVTIRQPSTQATDLEQSHDSAPLFGLTRHIALFCGLNMIAVLAMFVIIVQMAFLMPQRGAADSADIGLAIACGAAGVASGSALAGYFARRIGWWRCVTLGFCLAGIGYLALASVATFWSTSACALLSGLGVGLIIPTLLSAYVAGIPARSMGLAIGMWTAATFIAQFLNPPMFVALQDFLPSRDLAVAAMGGACLAVGLMLALTGHRYRFPGTNPNIRQETSI